MCPAHADTRARRRNYAIASWISYSTAVSLCGLAIGAFTTGATRPGYLCLITALVLAALCAACRFTIALTDACPACHPTEEPR